MFQKKFFFQTAQDSKKDELKGFLKCLQNFVRVKRFEKSPLTGCLVAMSFDVKPTQF